ncbi:MAG: 8-amino-7-oxononanoate synthase [Deltaproteobacteria bacterium]|nr:8-amino-7-oxononanoate synthase [Deltaproteobacteria bacterium]
MHTELLEELSKIEAAGLKRALKTVEGPQGPRVVVNGREVLLLCSNDYLGLANDPRLKDAAKKAIDEYGVGAGASRLVSGNMSLHEALEDRIRRFKGTQAALVFNSGYTANLGLITALSDRQTEIFSDRLDHASIIDACALSLAKVKRYRNRDVGSLERLLKKSTARRKLIVTDGVFSMDGTIAPVREIAGLLDKYSATLIIDDAHGTGVLGEHGKGTLEELGVSHPSIIQMGTLGKALGSFGAFVAGPKALIELLISKSRPFIFTTALPPAICAASIKALDIVEDEAERRARLKSNYVYLRAGLNAAGFETPGSTQIIPVIVGEAEKAIKASERLLEAGVFIQSIRPPTVPDGSSRLRITAMAAHTKEDLDLAIGAIKDTLLNG